MSLLDTCARRRAAGCCGTGSRIRCATQDGGRGAARRRSPPGSAIRAARRALHCRTGTHGRCRAHCRAHRARLRAAARSRRPARHARAPAGTCVDARGPARRRSSRALVADLAVESQWATLLTRAIAPSPRRKCATAASSPTGYDAELDELRSIDDTAASSWSRWKRASASAPASRTSRSSTTACTASTSKSRTRNAQKVPADYRRRQTLKNAERYITPELKAFEDKALSAQDRALAREKLLYDELLAALAPAIPALQRAGGGAGRARRARDAWPSAPTRSTSCGPSSISTPGLEIRGGRHPVVERQVEDFIAERPRPRARPAAADHHRPQHGRQVDLHAAGGADRAARALRIVRAGASGADRPARRDLHAHRRRRRSRRRPLDVHGRDDRGRRDPAPRDAAEPRADRRDRARHLDVRRARARVGDRAPSGREEPLPRRSSRRTISSSPRCPRRSTAAPTSTSTRSSTRTASCSCTRPRTAPRTAATDCRSRSSPACPADAIRRAKGYLARLDKFTVAGSSQADLFAPPGVAPPDDEPRAAVAAEAAAVAAQARRSRSRRDDAARRARGALRASEAAGA